MDSLSSTIPPSSDCSMKILEECQVSPSPNLKTSHPLTFLDIPWLLFPPTQPLFFYQLPKVHDHNNHYNTCNNGYHNESYYNFFDFKSTILPRLKQSLSSALTQFHLFAAKLTPSQSNLDDDRLVFTTDKNSSVKLTIAQCDADFANLCSYFPRNASMFHNLVPYLPQTITSSNYPSSLLAIQITYFPRSHAISIGFAYYSVLCDQRTFCNFLHTWASLNKFGDYKHGAPQTPNFDRSVILDSNELLPRLMKQWLRLRPPSLAMSNGKHRTSKTGHHLVRATFVMNPTHMQNAKQWIEAQCYKLNRDCPIDLSTYVVACAFTWYCVIKARQQENGNKSTKGPVCFGFIAGGITRLSFRVPDNYFGNCVGFGRAVMKREELLEINGLLAGADAISQTIGALDNDILGGADTWISDWNTLIGSEEHMSVVGSPKVTLYETDFGWGRPKKVEEVCIDIMKGMSLCESRDVKGGMEIGLTLPYSQMNAFSTLFSQGLHQFTQAQ